MLRSSLARSVRATPLRNAVGVRSVHAVSTPSLIDLDKRWESMAREEQKDLMDQLAERQKGPWTELTLAEKKAAYYIAFGPYGPRAPLHPPKFHLKVFMGVLGGLAASITLFLGIRSFAAGPPHTMTKEWQEATNEYLKEQKSDPITGISSEGYKGPGHVQSK
ncbi:cytochrome c oxidase subunit V [Saitoella complicata NRRL Y-17804]|uniref:Cytochrome c oxidase subunit IV n=1 Tax=Saitoella complicata (strain BCRC 22490 / CBS 7301 / JCM 7358 / NBRC 10748 / NRRL Y-17804) TaxID=698492 RepID=A0A0E9N912_SAICN|nr:cytochrome c oxidase subunit V [Saitoella complicata NRRL Y-17804]ODQ53167.1 cytochrome c oxidase subunit V [Saitoella complicata NRRL Y-17804]GAO46298.1 hypothetical protein G7K_0530-t1 [Saitoella complicata NRRL Y-17804]